MEREVMVENEDRQREAERIKLQSALRAYDLTAPEYKDDKKQIKYTDEERFVIFSQKIIIAIEELKILGYNPVLIKEELGKIYSENKKLILPQIKEENKDDFENSLDGKFIFDKRDVVEDITFAAAKVNDTYGFGFLLPKEIVRYSGKGIKRIMVGKEQVRAHAFITSNKELIEPSWYIENKHKVKFNTLPSNLKNRIDLKFLHDYLKGDLKNPDGKILLEDIIGIYKKFLFFSNEVWYDIHALWDMATYFFVLFNSFPILNMSGLGGTAKSKTMEVSRLFTLNPTEVMVNPSEASIFRITHENRPTKYIDEAEKLYVYAGGTWQTSPIVELINGSYTRGSTVPRQEKVGNKYTTIYYGCYSPTMIGSIAGLRDTTETRAITHIMTKAPDNDPRGELDVRDFENDPAFQNIRNRLYLFAWCNWNEIEKSYNELKVDNLKKRDFQIWRPLLTLAKILDKEIYNNVLLYAEKLSKQKKQDYISESSIDYKSLNYIKQRLDKNENLIYMKEIAENINKNSYEKTAEKTISTHLDKIGFKDFREKDRNGSYIKIDKNTFEIIVATICPVLSDYSSYSSYTSQNKEKEKKKSDEAETNGDEYNNKNVTNVMKSYENDGSIVKCIDCGSPDAFIIIKDKLFCKECAYKK